MVGAEKKREAIWTVHWKARWGRGSGVDASIDNREEARGGMHPLFGAERKQEAGIGRWGIRGGGRSKRRSGGGEFGSRLSLEMTENRK